MDVGMSMTMLTVFQIIGVMAAYLGVTLGLPWLLLRGKFRKLRLSVRFMAYFMAGNFYIMNLVFLLQLLHLSFRLTLIAGTLVPFLAVFAIKYRGAFGAVLERQSERTRVVFEGGMGKKTLMLRLGGKLKRISSGVLGEWLAPRWTDVLMTSGIVLLILVMYGVNAVRVYGYCASDMVLHNYWINYMDSNHIFVDGVYPFGFHCVIYYLHQVFAIPVYVLLRVFALTQTLMIHLVLLAFLRLICKSKYTPYMGVMVYVASDLFYQYTYYRYFAPLPQEYGMLFILPAVYFVIAFLREKDFGAVPRKGFKAFGDAGVYLIMFMISISMTLSAHFYDTMVAGLLCVGIAAGYCFRCFRWRYLKRLLIAGTAGILIAVLPMAAAFAMGTPLQGSLYWGMEQVTSGSGENVREEDETLPEGESGEESAGQEVIPEKSLGNTLGEKLDVVLGEVQYYVTNDSAAVAQFMLGSVGVLFFMGILWVILRRADYGAVMISFSIYMGILCLLQASPKLGLPQLIEVSRYSVYIGYGLPVVWSLALDGVLFLLFREKKAIHLGGMVVFAAACGAVLFTGVREPVCLSAYETNDAILCLTNILRENKDNVSWTICSANDEQQMTWGKGYHYETIDFLRAMESEKEDAPVIIPTDTVYFFIEKVPILYYDYLNTIRPDRKVSEEGARTPLAETKGILPYIGDARWVTMSHMYYWAQEFQKLYPNEMEVYYETDEFVCYRVRQDGYSPYDFAIAYDYE